MSLRSAIVKAFASTAVDYSLNGHAEVEEKALTIEPLSFPWGQMEPWGVFADARSGETPLTMRTAYAGTALAYICITKRATKLVEAPPMVVDETDAGDEWLEDHEVNPLLSKPNADYSFRRLYQLTSIYRDLTGRALWAKVRTRGQQTAALRVFSGNQFTVHAANGREFGRFEMSTLSGPKSLPPEDVIYFPGVDPWNPQGSIAPIDAALGALGIGSALQTAAKNMLMNALMPGGAITIPDALLDPEFERLQGQLSQTYGGARRAGKPMLLPAGASWQTISLSLAELMPADLISWVEATVCAVFELHPSMLGLKTGIENSPWSNLEQAQRMLYDEMCLPRWTADAEILTESLLRDYDDDPNHLVRFDTSDISVLQEDTKEKAEILKVIGPYQTYDENRAFMGLKPAGGEVGKARLVPMTWTPIEFLLEPPQPSPVMDPNAPDPNAEPEPPTEDEEE